MLCEQFRAGAEAAGLVKEKPMMKQAYEMGLQV